jgi:hypothetical protein
LPQRPKARSVSRRACVKSARRHDRCGIVALARRLPPALGLDFVDRRDHSVER